MVLKVTQKRRHPLSFGADDEEVLSNEADHTESVSIGDAFTEYATTVADSSEDASIVDGMGRNKCIN